MRRTLYNETLLVEALPHGAIDADTTTAGTAVDLAVYKNNFNDSVLFVFHTRTVADGDFVVSLEESNTVDDNYVAVPADRIQGTPPTFDGDNDDATYTFGYIPGGYRYVRLSIDSTNTDSGGVMDADALLSGASVTPVARA